MKRLQTIRPARWSLTLAHIFFAHVFIPYLFVSRNVPICVITRKYYKTTIKKLKKIFFFSRCISNI